MDRKTIRKNPQLKEFHEWLVASAAAGLVTRQETVSMIPPGEIRIRNLCFVFAFFVNMLTFCHNLHFCDDSCFARGAAP